MALVMVDFPLSGMPKIRNFVINAPFFLSLNHASAFQYSTVFIAWKIPSQVKKASDFTQLIN